MKTWFYPTLAALVLVLPAQAQTRRVGSFYVVVGVDPAGQDRSRAVVNARGEGMGQVRWECVEGGGVIVGVNLGALSRDDDVRRVEWRFDRDPPDTAELARANVVTWYLPADLVVPFTLRARTARRLVIHTLATRVEQVYDLDQAGPALDQLPCARGTPVPGRPPQRTPSVSGRVEREVPPDDGTYELSAVEIVPQIRNGAEIRRLVIDSFPPALRGLGVSGRVQVRFRVLENGRVDAESVQVTESTHEAFDAVAIAVVQRLQLSPGYVNGRPVRVWVELPLMFTAGATPPDSVAEPPPPAAERAG
jgi:TonB family protein